MPTTLTPRDIELVLFALQSTKTEFAVDYEKFAQLAGLKNKSTGSVIWGGVKKKLNAIRNEGAGGASASPGTGTPKSAKGKKRKQIDEVGADADDNEILTPSASKKAKRTPKSASPTKEEQEAVLSMEGTGDIVKPERED